MFLTPICSNVTNAEFDYFCQIDQKKGMSVIKTLRRSLWYVADKSNYALLSCRKGIEMMFGDCFDPQAEYFANYRMRPHWSQSGAIVFITGRTRDSIPKSVMKQWNLEKHQWIDRREERDGLCSTQGLSLEERISSLSKLNCLEFRGTFQRKKEIALDECHGACVLRDPACATIVADSLMHFDEQRYKMGDFVIMPNHFHALAVFQSAEQMERQYDSWLHWTAFQINRLMGSRGHFWQQEPFDHLIRNEEQYDFLRQYIADNPQKANLPEGEYIYRRLTQSL